MLKELNLIWHEPPGYKPEFTTGAIYSLGQIGFHASAIKYYNLADIPAFRIATSTYQDNETFRIYLIPTTAEDKLGFKTTERHGQVLLYIRSVLEKFDIDYINNKIDLHITEHKEDGKVYYCIKFNKVIARKK